MESCESCPIPGACGKCLKGGLPMKKEIVTALVLFFLGLSVVLGVLLVNTKRQVLQLTRAAAGQPTASASPSAKQVKLPTPRTYATTIALPAPKLKGTMSVEQAIDMRRSRRTFAATPLTEAQLSQILWAAQGITDVKNNLRTAPSAFNVYPFTVYVLVRNVTGLTPGLYEYLPATHALGDMKVVDASLVFNASGIEAGAQQTPVVLILSAALDKGYDKMKAGAASSAYLEGGHIGENIYLEVESLKLSTVVMGGVGTAAQALKLDPAETIVYVIPIGNRAPDVVATPVPVKE